MQLKKTASSTVKKLYNKISQNYSAKLAGSKSLLYNKYVLYVSFAVCLMNVLIWLFSGEFVHVAIFMLVGYLTSYFSKNMIVILVIALVVSNVIKSGANIALEGMTNKDKKDEGDKNPKKKEGMNGKEKDNKKKKEGMDNEKEETQEGADEEVSEGVSEGVDENPENADEKPCTTDKDCAKDFKCNDKLVCIAK
jgi:hypothetical protein